MYYFQAYFCLNLLESSKGQDLGLLRGLLERGKFKFCLNWGVYLGCLSVLICLLGLKERCWQLFWLFMYNYSNDKRQIIFFQVQIFVQVLKNQHRRLFKQRSILFLVFYLLKADYKDIEMSDKSQAQSYLIEEMIFYSILQPETLSLEKIQKQTPKVGVLKHYQKANLISVEDEDQFFQMWAYPDGLKIFDSQLKVINDNNPEYSFGESHFVNVYSQNTKQEQPKNYIYSFVHTDYSLNRTYFSALCWHQKKYIPLRENLQTLAEQNIYSKSLPKCTLWELQNNPLLIDKDHILVYLPKVLLITSKLPIFTFQRQMLRFYYRNVLSQVGNPIINSKLLEYFTDLAHVAGYPQAEIEFDGSEQTILGKSSKSIQVERMYLQRFYASFFFLPKINTKTGQIQFFDCLNSSIKITNLQLGSHQCFKRPNIDIISVIRKVGVKNILCLWKCIILQKHILVFSMNNNLVIDVFETLLYLIEPIKWENIYIPFLPLHLVNNIDAIQSYLIGMSKIHMNYVIEHFQNQMKDIVLYDLDENILVQNTLDTIQLPIAIKELITQRLASLGFKRDKLFSSFFSESADQKLSQVQKIFRIKQIFFDALVYLLNNYRPFASLKEDNLLSFDRESYKRIFKEEQWSKFAARLNQTMIFVRLCEYHLYQQKILKWNQQNIGGLFVYCQNIICSKNKKDQFWLIPKYIKGSSKWPTIPYYEYINYVIEKDMKYIKQNVRTYKVQSYLIKYIGWLQMQQETSLVNRRENKVEGNSLFKSFMQFIFPWLSELEFKQNNYNRKGVLSSKIKDNNLLHLDNLFSNMREQYLYSNKNDLIQTVKAYREHKYSFLNSKAIGQRRDRLKKLKERISV